MSEFLKVLEKQESPRMTDSEYREFLENESKKGRMTATERYEQEEFELKRKIDTMFAGIGFILMWMLLIIIYGLFI